MRVKHIILAIVDMNSIKIPRVLGIYSHLDHMDKTRRSNYYKRHSGVETKEQAIKKEMKKGMSPKLLSHIFLW